MVQKAVEELILALRRVGSEHNTADHFTKLLPQVPFNKHTNAMMGTRFLTRFHLEALELHKLNDPKLGGDESKQNSAAS